jgi:hypothetical protein
MTRNIILGYSKSKREFKVLETERLSRERNFK